MDEPGGPVSARLILFNRTTLILLLTVLLLFLFALLFSFRLFTLNLTS